MGNLKISAIQMNICENLMTNLITAKEMVEKCEGHIVVLPELFTGGFTQHSKFYAESNYKTTIPFLKEISKERKILLIAGVTEKNKNDKNRPFNSAVVYKNGIFVGKYRKIKLFKYNDEHLYYSAGDKNKILTFKFKDTIIKDTIIKDTTIGLMICYDLRFPEIAREIMRQGAEIIIVPANFPDERKDHWKALLKARAIENLCYVVGVNANEIHTEHVNGNFGNTSCYDAWGNSVNGKIQKLNNGKIFEFEINLEEVKKIRNKYKFLEDA